MKDEINVYTEGYKKGENFKVRRAVHRRMKASEMEFYFLVEDSIRLLREMNPIQANSHKDYMKKLAKQRGTSQIHEISEAINFYMDITEQPYVEFVQGKGHVKSLGDRKVFIYDN